MKIYDFEQKSEEWFNIRLGKFTGSNFHIFFGNSKTKETELYKKAAERITKTRSDSDNFSNVHIERGIELESEARSMYELETMSNVKEVGFIKLDEFCGCSPDGLVDADGMIEIKCKDNHTFLKQIIREEKAIEPIYRTQIQFNLYVSGRKWCDYVCYNPNFKQALYIKRIDRDEEYIQKIKDYLKICNFEINEIIRILNRGSNEILFL